MSKPYPPKVRQMTPRQRERTEEAWRYAVGYPAGWRDRMLSAAARNTGRAADPGSVLRAWGIEA
ncbi:hypothetical protein [Agromyces sp. NPDC058104]|uniref:hypothetical protein n=1 Tax=Agromyces sp. NPDC058104 TaxID=3346342 RepID=UPI0036DF5265